MTSTQQTTQAGVFSFPALNVGTYTVTVEMKDFRMMRRPGNTLEVGTPLDIPVTLEIGDTAEVVTVEERAEALETTNATIGNVVTHKEVTELPLNGRNPLALLVLEPGVIQLSKGSDGTGIHVNGSRDMASNTTIDGIEANESAVSNPMNNIYRLNPDSIQEYKVTTSNATAEQGRNSGASVSIATRSGSNKFRGSLFESSATRHSTRRVLLQRAGNRQAGNQAEPVRRRTGRTDQAQPNLLLRQLAAAAREFFAGGRPGLRQRADPLYTQRAEWHLPLFRGRSQ